MKQAINPVFPIAEVRSAEELMDIAVAMEAEAARRYEELSERMAAQDEPELAGLFRELAVLERQHEAGLGRWAERQGWRTPRPAHFAWQMPETFGAEADGAEALVLTPYRALGIAVRNEERAFSFYAYLAAISPDDQVRSRAEALAREELEHVAQLRALRRRAYHADRAGTRRKGRIGSAAELQAVAGGLEAGAAGLAEVAAQVLAQTGHAQVAAMLAVLAEAARRRAGTAPPGGAASTVVEAARAAGLLQPGMLTATGAMRLALRDAEEILETYLAAAEQPGADEAVVALAQRLAEAALARLAQIRASLTEAED